MKRVLLALCFFAATCAKAQDNFVPIDRKYVEKTVTDESKETFYDKLLKRFNDFDTTLTKEEFRLIYYGFAFQPEYSSFVDEKQADINDAIKKNKFRDVIKICDAVLKTTPISLRANFYKGFALYSLNKGDSTFKQYNTRYMRLRDAILSTGDGLTCKTGFRVLFVSDEYDIMYRYFSIEGVNKQYLESPCDHFEVNPSKLFISPNIYFDCSEALLSEEKMFKIK